MKDNISVFAHIVATLTLISIILGLLMWSWSIAGNGWPYVMGAASASLAYLTGLIIDN
jgi:hypothetical protein